MVETSELSLLSNLQTVGKSLSTLIYSPLDDVGFEELNNICKSLFATIHRIPRLTDYLVMRKYIATK